MSDPLNPTPADSATQPYAAPSPYAPEGTGSASYAASAQDQQPQYGQPGADQYAQYGQGSQASYGDYGQPMYTSPSSAQFDSLRTQAIIAIVLSVISWFIFWFLLSIPSVIWSFIIDSNAKNQGAPQSILSLTKAAKVVSIVMVSIQAFFIILWVIVALLD